MKKIKLKIIFLVLVGFLQISNSFVFGVGHPTDVEEEDNCPICLVPLIQDGEGDIVIPGIRTLGCGHRLHEDCFQGMLNQADYNVASQCPLCRARHNIPFPERAQVPERAQDQDRIETVIVDMTLEINNVEEFDGLKNRIMELQEDGVFIHLDLRLGRRITEIPEVFFEDINNLVWLNLGNNKLKSVPESLGGITSLEKLDLGNNKLKSLPDSIGNLTSLERLYLERNKLKSLPDSIMGLENLNYINLSWNRFLFRPQVPPHVRLYFNEKSQLGVRIKNMGIIVAVYSAVVAYVSVVVILDYLMEKMENKQNC